MIRTYNNPEERIRNTSEYNFLLTTCSHSQMAAIDRLLMPLRYGTDNIVRKPKIKRVVHNNPATIVLWTDGTKTVVKCDEREAYDPEKGLAMAFSKKFFGNEGNYYEQFKKWLPEEEEVEEVVQHTPMKGSLKEAFDNFNDQIRAAFSIPGGDRRCSVCKHETKLTIEDPCRECCQISRHPFFEKKEEK